ncbi:hypothetical protein Q8F55_007057 [Vanrija albida]|uniref:Uncharacterized protein n=1 Tax=Vanrija albida TaxID=181172 RepID=A0ABR3PYV2_9TREE
MDIWKMSNSVTYVWKPGDKVRALEAIRDSPRYRQHFFPPARGSTRLAHKWKAERDLCLELLRNEMWMKAAHRSKLVTREGTGPDGPVWKPTPKWTSAVSNPIRTLVASLKRQMKPDGTGKNYFEKEGAERSWKTARDVPKSMKVFLKVHPYYFILLDLVHGDTPAVLPPPRAPTVEPPGRSGTNPRLQQLAARRARVRDSSPELVEDSESDSPPPGSESSPSPSPSRSPLTLPPASWGQSSSEGEEDELHPTPTPPKREPSPSSSPAPASTPTMDHPSKRAFAKSLSYVDDQLRRSASGSRKRARSPSTSSASTSSAEEGGPAPAQRPRWAVAPDTKPDIEELDMDPPTPVTRPEKKRVHLASARAPASRGQEKATMPRPKRPMALEIDSDLERQLNPPSPSTRPRNTPLPSKPMRGGYSAGQAPLKFDSYQYIDEPDFDPPSPTPVGQSKRVRSPSTSSASSSSSSSDEPPPLPRPRWSAPLEIKRSSGGPAPGPVADTISIYTVSSSASSSSHDSDDDDSEDSVPTKPKRTPQTSQKNTPRQPTHKRFTTSPEPKRSRHHQNKTAKTQPAGPIALKWFSPTVTLKNYWPTVTWLMGAEPSVKKPLLAARRAQMAGSRRLGELLKAYEDLLDPRGTRHRHWDEAALRAACTSKFMAGCRVYSPTEGQLVRRLLLLGECAGMTRLSEAQFLAQVGKDNRLILLKAAPEHDPLLKHKVLDGRGAVGYWHMSPLSFMLVVETNFLRLVDKLRKGA